MSSNNKSNFMDHPILQMAIMIGFGLLALAGLCDIVFLFGTRPIMAQTAYWLITGGLVIGLVAAPLAVLDWLAIPHDDAARTLRLIPVAGGLTVLLAFVLSWLLRWGNTQLPGGLAILSALIGVCLAVGTVFIAHRITRT